MQRIKDDPEKVFWEWMFESDFDHYNVPTVDWQTTAHGLNVNQIYFVNKGLLQHNYVHMYCLRLLLWNSRVE